MRTRHPAVALASALLFALSCGESPDGPPGGSGPTLRILSGAGLSDTIEALPNQQLVVRVWWPSGEPAGGLAVVFNAADAACQDWYAGCLRMLFAPVMTDSFDVIESIATDANGRAVMRLRMGTLAGPAPVVITVPDLALADTAAFTVRPGAAVGVGAFPRDTTADLGGTFVARAGVVDRADNLRSEPVGSPVTFEATSPAVQVSGSGSVSAVAIGRAYVRVRATVGGRTGTDSIGITVVPKARVAVAVRDGLVLMSLAGGAARQLVPAAGGTNGSPAWSPTGDRIAYSTCTSSGSCLLAITDTLGQATALALPGIEPGWPEYSRDGLWIYFHEYAGPASRAFRVHPDGSGLEALTPPGEYGDSPSPSPDGTRFAYTDGWRHLLVKTIATGHVDTLETTGALGVAGTRWSPDGNWIAFLDPEAGIGLIRPDGSGERAVGHGWYLSLNWSPDSNWLIATTDLGTIALADVAAGTVYRLTTRGVFPAWRP